MKTLRTLLAAVALLGGALTMNAQRMSIAAMQSNARFLTDRMAYTLGVTDPFLIDEIYRINYDYIWGVNDYLDDVALGYYYDDYMTVCAARDAALRTLLGVSLWNRVVGYSYFYRPIAFANRGWRFSIYDHDRYGAHYYHYTAPRPIARGYAGGHFFRGMAPRGGRVAGPVPGVAPRGGHVTPPAQHRGGDIHHGNAGHVQQPRGNHNGGYVQQPSTQPRNGQSVMPGAANSQPRNGRSSGNMNSSSRGGVSRSAGTVSRGSAGSTTRSSATGRGGSRR